MLAGLEGCGACPLVMPFPFRHGLCLIVDLAAAEGDEQQQRERQTTVGHDFDTVAGHRTMRLSYAASEAEVTEAIGRLRRWLA